MENSTAVPQESKEKITVSAHNSITIYTKELKEDSHQDICTPMFMTVKR